MQTGGCKRGVWQNGEGYPDPTCGAALSKKHNVRVWRSDEEWERIMIGAEDREQIVIFQWANMMTGLYPELKWLYHVPNERKCSIQQGALLKRKGVKSGVPDIFLDVPRGSYHGLRIELKAGKGKTTDAQNEWLDNLRKQGYYACVCYGADQAILTIKGYLHERKDL